MVPKHPTCATQYQVHSYIVTCRKSGSTQENPLLWTYFMSARMYIYIHTQYGLGYSLVSDWSQDIIDVTLFMLLCAKLCTCCCVLLILCNGTSLQTAGYIQSYIFKGINFFLDRHLQSKNLLTISIGLIFHREKFLNDFKDI